MARISPVEPDQATPAVRSLYETLRADLGIEPNNFFKTMAHNPELLRPLIEFSRVLLESGDQLFADAPPPHVFGHRHLPQLH